MSNLNNRKVILKFNNSALMLKNFSSLYSNFILNSYIVYELNAWPRNRTNSIKTNDIEKKITDHDHSNRYITIQEFNKLTSDNCASRQAQANLASKNDVAALVKKTDFNDKLKKLNKKVTSNKTKHIKAEKKITDLTNKVTQISENEYYFLVGKMYFTGNDGYQNFLVFLPMLSSLILDSNKKLLTEYIPEYHLQKLPHLILILDRPCLIQTMVK